MKELEQSDKKEFKGVFVPAEILMAQDLTPLQKLLYAEILALSGNDGCFASSSHFAKHLCITERRIRSNLADLEKLGYIERTVTKKNVRVIQIKIFGEVGRKCPKSRTETSGEVGRKCPKGRTETSGEVGRKCPKGRTETSGEVGRKRPHKYNNKNNINKNVNRNINTNIKEIDTIDIVKNGLDDICKLYIREISSKTCCSPLETDKLNKLITEYGANKVSEAIEIAVIQNKRSLAYIEGVLKFSGGDENGNSSKEKGMVRQGPTTRCKGLYKQGKVETIESSEAKFANETSGWD